MGRQKEKVMEFLKKYKIYFIIGAIVIFIAALIPLFISGDKYFRSKQKASKILIDSLHKDNIKLLNELKITRDSVEILHNLALTSVARDTIYVNQIKYIKNKTNEEISHFNSLSRDSQYRVFSDLTEEYSRTRFGKDTL